MRDVPGLPLTGAEMPDPSPPAVTLFAAAALAAIFAADLLLFWLPCRLRAARCPRCGSRWRTELYGEWGGDEQWDCRACGGHWGTRR